MHREVKHETSIYSERSSNKNDCGNIINCSTKNSGIKTTAIQRTTPMHSAILLIWLIFYMRTVSKRNKTQIYGVGWQCICRSVQSTVAWVYLILCNTILWMNSSDGGLIKLITFVCYCAMANDSITKTWTTKVTPCQVV